MTVAEEPAWRQLRLSLERPYKDDDGVPIPRLFDIDLEGKHVYEPQDDLDTRLADQLRRIFLERGSDFFDKTEEGRRPIDAPIGDQDEVEHDDETGQQAAAKPMSPEELLKMRLGILPSLHVALGEMTLARDMLALLLSSNEPKQAPAWLPGTSFTAADPSLRTAIISNSQPISSLKAFNAQLVLGGKDEALRSASLIFRQAAESMERSASRSDTYWANALKVRRGNWGISPAPLPPGTHLGKGADRSARDFVISFGLEESPLGFRHMATGHMEYESTRSTSTPIVTPRRRKVRLHISLTIRQGESTHVYHNRIRENSDQSLSEHLSAVKTEVLEQEIFNELIKEAGNLPSAAARVSERLVFIEVAKDVDLQVELVEAELPIPSNTANSWQAVCDFIYNVLHILLLRLHAHRKKLRLESRGPNHPERTRLQTASPPLLQPVIDLLQYKVFCDRVETELDRMLNALSDAGIPAQLRLNPVGESGEKLVDVLHERVSVPMTGSALLRIDDSQSIQLTFSSPSTLTAHLSESTLSVTSVPQLCQLLIDEVELGLLERIKGIGTQVTAPVGGSWFVDLLTGCTVGRWGDHIITFRITCADTFHLGCTVSQGTRHKDAVQAMWSFPPTIEKQNFFIWVDTVMRTLVTP